MTHMSKAFKTVLVSAVAASAFMAAPAHAASKTDVENCRAAFAQEGNVNIEEYRLRFKRETGKRTRTIHFKAIPRAGGDAVELTCTIKRSKVLAVNSGQGEVSLLADNKTK